MFLCSQVWVSVSHVQHSHNKPLSAAPTFRLPPPTGKTLTPHLFLTGVSHSNERSEWLNIHNWNEPLSTKIDVKKCFIKLFCGTIIIIIKHWNTELNSNHLKPEKRHWKQSLLQSDSTYFYSKSGLKIVKKTRQKSVNNFNDF